MAVSRRAVSVLLLAASALIPLALSCPPDPIWISGVFDGADADDVIATATAMEGIAAGTAPSTGSAALVVLGPTPPPRSIPSDGAVTGVLHGRAPPA